MFRRLRQMLVQSVPEQLSICEFECSVTRCTTSRWASCQLRLQGVPDADHGNVRGVLVRHGTPVQLDLGYRKKLLQNG